MSLVCNVLLITGLQAGLISLFEEQPVTESFHLQGNSQSFAMHQLIGLDGENGSNFFIFFIHYWLIPNTQVFKIISRFSYLNICPS